MECDPTIRSGSWIRPWSQSHGDLLQDPISWPAMPIKPDIVFQGFSKLDLPGDALKPDVPNVRVRLVPGEASRDGFTWTTKTWASSQIWAIEGSYVAMLK